MANVYAIMGGWSSYSDRQEWIVAVHLSQVDAEQHLQRLREALAAWIAFDGDEREILAGGPNREYRCTLDMVRGFYTMLEDQRYWLEEVPALASVPEVPGVLRGM